MEQSAKNLLIYICIIIFILIILRVLYTTLNKYNNNIENFIIDNNNAVDLLSTKIKSTDALIDSNQLSTNQENSIHPWSNRIYNLDNTMQQQKPIALYKPNLFINNVQYCKLGDMISQDVNYSIPTETEFTLLIKKIGSDIKPPKNYTLVFNNQLTDITKSLQIYKPLPPDGYLSLGHVFCNIDDDLKKIRAAQNVACVPKNCVKEIRNWLASDKIFEYDKDDKYCAIYFNPYTGTFISTNTHQLPTGKVSKVVACVAKCTAVDDLKKADDCARKYYNINKKAISNTPVIPNLVSDQEEEFYLSKIKVQSDSIAKLGQRAQQMQLNMDKASIVNREMNKNVLQDYVDTQKRNIAIIMQRLIDDRNKINTNVNMTTHVFNTIIESPTIPLEQKKLLISKLNNNYTENLNEVLYSLPEYDLTGLVKKTLVSDVVYGCDDVQ